MVEPGSVRSAADHLAAQAHVDVRRGLDLTHEVVRHPGGERLRADDERHARGVARQVQRRLPGGVGAAHDVHLEPLEALAASAAGPP